MIDINVAMENHCKLIGVKTNSQIEYEYLVNSNDLYAKLMLAHRDLGYDLKQEIRNGRGRDRFVVNASELERAINEAIVEELNGVGQEMVDQVSQGVINQVNAVCGGTSKSGKSSFNIGKMLGRALGRTAVKVLDELTRTK